MFSARVFVGAAGRKVPVVAALAVTLTVVVVAAFAGESTPAQATGRAVAPSAYPGGKGWQPGPPRYGTEAATAQRITMDDGTELAAVVAYPASLAGGARAPGKFPVIGLVTAYSDAFAPLPSFFVQYGYIVVKINERGTALSGGVRDIGGNGEREGRDMAAVVDWLRELPGSNGSVGLTGTSEAGRAAIAAATYVKPNSGLKALAVATSAMNLFQGAYTSGGIPSSSVLSAANCAALGTISAPNTSWADAYCQNAADAIAGGATSFENGYYTNALVNQAKIPAIVENGIKVLSWTDWLDQGSGGVDFYVALQQAAKKAFGSYPGPMKDTDATPDRGYQIVIGPWGGPYPKTGHGVGIDLGIQLEWFETWLKGVDTGLDETKTTMHVYEVNRGWFNTTTWPVVAASTPYYLNASGALTKAKPAAAASDTIPWAQPDAGGKLSFTTTPFASGASLVGPLSATIYASSSNSNLELIGMLWDVAPDGTETYMTRGTVTGARRHLAGDSASSGLTADANWKDKNGVVIRPFADHTWDDYLAPGREYRFHINLRRVGYAIPPGHSLRLTVTTQATPADCTASGTPNPCLYTKPQQLTLPGGVYTIKRSPTAASAVNLPLLPYDAFKLVTGGPTPTSTLTQSADWDTPSKP
jgi:predicted acyl esterase